MFTFDEDEVAASVGIPMTVESQRIPRPSAMPRCRLSLNDLEQLNAVRSESFHPEKLHSPRLSCASTPSLTPRRAVLGAANLSVHGTFFFQSITPHSQPLSTETQSMSHSSDVSAVSMDSETLQEDSLLSEDSIVEEKGSLVSQHIFDFESPSVIRESLYDRILDIKSFCVDTGKVDSFSCSHI